ncbi:hypothetical protein LPN04_03740 [Rugamonas sp. A1-17]|nr:hypothetical protein [Rugamonas sp. A1-17]
MAPAIVHTPGLFTSRAKGRLDLPMALSHIMGRVMFSFSGPQLGPIELRVLQALVGFAGLQQQQPVAIDPSGSLDEVQRLLGHTVAISTTYNQLAEVVGYAINSGSAQTAIRTAIRKLGSVGVSIRQANLVSGPDFSAGNLICDEFSNRHIEVELNSILTAAVHGGRGTYIRLDLPEARQLHSDAARLLHHRLHWVNAGTTREVSLDKMIGYVWSAEDVSASAQRTRRQVLRGSLDELTSIGWSSAPRGDLYQIARPIVR